ncbi:MAG: FkbM family methyltransferase [Chloroflexi bacterium]|nr:FkbM family methyltransferase [Chloroflexota bacterium]
MATIRRGPLRSAAYLCAELSRLKRAAPRETYRAYRNAVLRRLPQIVRQRSLSPADQRMAGRDWVFTPLGKPIAVEGDHFGTARELYARKAYFLAPGFGLAGTDIVVDLGAHRGMFTALAALHAARVVAVEAQKEFMPAIRSTVEKVRPGKHQAVTAIAAYVGSGTGFFADQSNPEAAADKLGQSITMSQLMAQERLPRIDFLKVDIEGSEFDLFMGSDTAWLDTVRRIAIEVHPEYGDPVALRRALEQHGFKTWLFDADTRPVDGLGNASGYLLASRNSS